MIVILGQVDIHPDDVEAAAELMRVLSIESSREKGCLHYAYSRDLAMPNRFQLSELWESDEALAAHFQMPHIAAYRAGMKPLRVEKRLVKKYEGSEVGTL